MTPTHHRIPQAARLRGWVVRAALSLGVAAGGLVLGASSATAADDGLLGAVTRTVADVPDVAGSTAGAVAHSDVGDVTAGVRELTAPAEQTVDDVVVPVVDGVAPVTSRVEQELDQVADALVPVVETARPLVPAVRPAVPVVEPVVEEPGGSGLSGLDGGPGEAGGTPAAALSERAVDPADGVAESSGPSRTEAELAAGDPGDDASAVVPRDGAGRSGDAGRPGENAVAAARPASFWSQPPAAVFPDAPSGSHAHASWIGPRVVAGVATGGLPVLTSGADTAMLAVGAESGPSLRAGSGEAAAVLAALLVLGLVVFRGRTQERSKPRSLAGFEVPVSPA